MISVFFTGDFHLVILPEKYFKNPKEQLAYLRRSNIFKM